VQDRAVRVRASMEGNATVTTLNCAIVPMASRAPGVSLVSGSYSFTAWRALFQSDIVALVNRTYICTVGGAARYHHCLFVLT